MPIDCYLLESIVAVATAIDGHASQPVVEETR